MVNSPLIRPAISWGIVALGGFPLGSHDNSFQTGWFNHQLRLALGAILTSPVAAEIFGNFSLDGLSQGELHEKKQKVGCFIWRITLPETNSSHLKIVVSNRNLLFQGGPIFRCYVSFSEDYTTQLYRNYNKPL